MAGLKLKVQRYITPMADADPLRVSEASTVTGYLASFALTVVATAMAVGVDSGITIPNISLLFVVPVVVAGVGYGLGPSLFSAVLGALAYNFFLTDPRYTLVVDDPAYIWAIALLFVVGLIVSGVAFTSRLRASDAALLRRQTTVVQDYGGAVLAADKKEAIVSITSQTLATLFQVPSVVILFSEGEMVSVNTVGGIEPGETEFEAARTSLETGTVARAGIYPSVASRFDFWPVTPAGGQRAVLGVAFDPGERPSAEDTLVGIVGSVLALALSSQHFPIGRNVRSTDRDSLATAHRK
jgi:two-component system sensor histidine kinase KdpD